MKAFGQKENDESGRLPIESKAKSLTLRQAIQGQWQDVGSAIRIASCLLLGTGTLLLVAGIAGDQFGWWAEHNFLTNVLSSLTGACFGIPAAILLFAAIEEHRAAITHRRELIHQGTLAAERLRVSAAAFKAVEPGKTLIGPATQIVQGVASYRQILDSPGSDTVEIRHGLRRLGAGIDKSRELMMRSLPFSIAEGERQWAELSSSWRSISDVLRKDYLASGLPWLEDATQANLQKWLYDKPNPFQYILEFRDYYLPEYAAECERLSRDEGPIDLLELRSLRLHHMDQDEVWREGLPLLELLDDLHGGVEAASVALSHAPGAVKQSVAGSSHG